MIPAESPSSNLPFWKMPSAWMLLIPVIGIVWVWASSLSFVPVPWPDDSAFYFPAKDLFSWPPRWVMIPQAPFEPTYREWNFNTMPLFPILIGLLRMVGIDGSHALKILPLGGWFLSASFTLYSLIRGRASRLLIFAAALVLTFDPIIRWHSVLIRPESLIGAMGVFILCGSRFGWPNFLRERKYFHPVSLALWVAAMLHFNAIHLVPIVLVLYWSDWKKIFKIASLTACGLIPWIITILLKPALFVEQMLLQFNRLNGYHNPWLSTFAEFQGALTSDMGTPEPWSAGVRAAVLVCVFALPFFIVAFFFLCSKERAASREGRTLIASFTWFVSTLYLWHTKAEVWFTGYFHLAYWVFALLVLHELARAVPKKFSRLAWSAAFFPLVIGGAFVTEQYGQASRLGAVQSWKWETYDDWVNCIDSFLVQEYSKRGSPKTFRVWAPNFPDILIELSRKHPDWEFTRTNDFSSRWHLGVQHGYEVDAMVVTENFRQDEEFYTGALAGKPEVRSVWMNWEGYFLITLERDKAFKTNRFLCQRGRWDAFIYLNP